MYDWLDEVADELYPPARLEELEALRPKRPIPAAAPPSDTTSVPIEPSTSLPDAVDSDSDSDEEDLSIEASIARELEALKSAGKGVKKARVEGGAEGKGKAGEKKEKQRFTSVDTGTECVLFIGFRWPYDPIEIASEMVRRTMSTGTVQSRFARRLEPVQKSCHTNSMDQIQLITRELVRKSILDWAKANDATSVTTIDLGALLLRHVEQYKIDPSIRSHTVLNRDIIIELVGKAAQAAALPVPPPSAATSNQEEPSTPAETAAEYSDSGMVTGEEMSLDPPPPPAQEAASVTSQSIATTSLPVVPPSAPSIPTEPSSQELQSTLLLRADLTSPNLVFIPTILKNTYGISCVEGSLYTKGRRFNLDGCATDWRRAQGDGGEEEKGSKTSVVVGEGEGEGPRAD